MKDPLSIIIPAKNEGPALENLLPALAAKYPDAELIVVDDGSDDQTPQVCLAHKVQHVRHPYSKGNGAAIKTGARAAKGEVLVFMDGDGQHNPADIKQLLEKLHTGFDMVVGSRHAAGHASRARRLANALYNWLASRISGHQIHDLTSGFRAARADCFREFLTLLPNGFSYPTTSTMAFLRAGYSVGFVPVTVANREGKSHIHPLMDGIRFFLIIFKVGTLYSPLKIFLPVSFVFFLLGISYYLYTFVTEHQFTNMGALLLSIAIIIFLIGLVSEQITALMYKK